MDNPDRFLDPRGNHQNFHLEWKKKTHHLVAGPNEPRLRGRQHVALTLQGSSAHQELPMSLTCRRPRR